MNKSERIFNLVVGMGETLILCDAETLRVIETMDIVAKSMGLETFDSFIITNGLFVTATMGEHTYAKSKQIRTRTSNLGNIDAINTLSRNIAAGIVTLDQAEDILSDIRNNKIWSIHSTFLFIALGCSALTVLYGGTYYDALVSFVISLISKSVITLLAKRRINNMITNLFASFCISVIAIISTRIGVGDNVDKIIIGSIMALVPGILLTNGIRDITNNDFLSGIIRIIEALLIATSIAVGVGAAFYLI